VSDTTNIFEEQPDRDTVGGRISRAREAIGLSTKDLAWRLGVKNASVKGWESDRAQPSSHRLTNLAGLLKVSLSWILHGVGIGPSEDDDASENAGEDVAAQISRLRLLHVETGMLIEQLRGEVDRRASVR
jgi:ribosome-binding protein aMBF1 (putative translation factor)